MKRALLFAAVLFVIAPPGSAQQRARDSGECYAFADLALNAAAHAKHGVAREKFDAMVPDLYDFKAGPQRDLARRITDAAWAAARAGVVPSDFANALNRICHQRSGDMDSILGGRL